MPRENSNVIQLAYFHRQLDEAAGNGDSSEAVTDFEHTSELQAIASCLDYLYTELRKLDQSMSARLVGAAAECLRQEVCKSEEDQ